MRGLSAWRIRAVVSVVHGIRWVAGQELNTTTTIERNHVYARVATYRNGYGTHFQCTSTCYLTMWAYLACVAALLALLAVIPVQSPSKPENAPFVLWLGNNNPDDQDSALVSKKTPKRVYGILDRLSMWIHGYEEAESSDSDDARAVFREDIDLFTQQAEPAITFESVGVETDDSLLPRIFIHAEREQDDLMLVEDVDTLFDPLPPSPRNKKPGIFAPVTPRSNTSQTPGGGDNDGADTSRRRPGASLVRQASIAAAGGNEPSATGRRATVVGSTVSDTTREDLLAAVERRTSMQKRAEKRKEYAKSDIAHDNLHEHELDMYEYLEFVRSLLEGIALKKITQKSGKVVKRTFFITPNLSTVYWNQMGNKGWISKKSSIVSTEISHVTKGADGNTAASKLKPEKLELCITVVMNGGKRLVLEAKDATMRQRLFLGFSRLAVEKREEKRKREAGELDDVQQEELGSDEALERALRSDQQQQEDEDEDEEDEEEKAEEQGKAATQRGEPSRLPDDAEREAKSEEDDPERWRVQPEEGGQSVDEA